MSDCTAFIEECQSILSCIEQWPHDYHRCLGVNRKCTEADIKKAYKKLSLSLHPDRNKSEDAAQRFCVISDACETLCDNEKRALYMNARSVIDRWKNHVVEKQVQRVKELTLTRPADVFYSSVFYSNVAIVIRESIEMYKTLQAEMANGGQASAPRSTTFQDFMASIPGINIRIFETKKAAYSSTPTSSSQPVSSPVPKKELSESELRSLVEKEMTSISEQCGFSISTANISNATVRNYGVSVLRGMDNSVYINNVSVFGNRNTVHSSLSYVHGTRNVLRGVFNIYEEIGQAVPVDYEHAKFSVFIGGMYNLVSKADKGNNLFFSSRDRALQTGIVEKKEGGVLRMNCTEFVLAITKSPQRVTTILPLITSLVDSERDLRDRIDMDNVMVFRDKVLDAAKVMEKIIASDDRRACINAVNNRPAKKPCVLTGANGILSAEELKEKLKQR